MGQGKGVSFMQVEPVDFDYACEAYLLLSSFVREGKVVPELYNVEKIKVFVEYMAKRFKEGPIAFDVKEKNTENVGVV